MRSLEAASLQIACANQVAPPPIRSLAISVLPHPSLITIMADVAQLSIPLPRSLDTRIYMRLAAQAKTVVLSLTTAAPDEPPPPMGSLVYALPDVGTPGPVQARLTGAA